jgi:hypothetical protein
MFLGIVRMDDADGSIEPSGIVDAVPFTKARAYPTP